MAHPAEEPDRQVAGRPGARGQAELLRFIARSIAELDALLTRQVNAVLHHPAFQRLEAAWRGLRCLLDDAEQEQGVKVKLLDVSKRELHRDLDTAVEFDQSSFFRKVYRNEFKMPGGEPFAALIADYEFSHHAEDVDLLLKIGEVAALAFCPFVAGAAPELLDAGDRGRTFAHLEVPRNLDRQFASPDYDSWQQLRRHAHEAMFLGLTLPHILLRLPYGQGMPWAECFDFREEVEADDARKCLWGNGAFAFGRVLLRAFAQAGWPANIRGVTCDEAEGGLVTGLPAACLETDRPGVVTRCPTDLLIADTQDAELAAQGLIPLCCCQGTPYCAIYSCPSLRQPPAYLNPSANANAGVAAMLPFVLCASRFAHYLNAMARDLIGAAIGAEEIQTRLNDWLSLHVLDDPEAAPEDKAKFPLRAAQCEVRSRPGKSGAYDCVVHLQPHYQLEAMNAMVELRGLRVELPTTAAVHRQAPLAS